MDAIVNVGNVTSFNAIGAGPDSNEASATAR
jgi:hypothetical protein